MKNFSLVIIVAVCIVNCGFATAPVVHKKVVKLPPMPKSGPALCQGKYLTPEQGKLMLDRRLEKMTNWRYWQDYVEHLRKCILKGADLDPLPKRVPLNPIIRNKRRYDGYTVENVAFESVPGYYAACNLYRPTDANGPFPVVLCPVGHWGDSRFNPSVQIRCAMLARMGAVAMSIGTFGWGESPDQAVRRIHVKPLALTMQTWNNMRALDFLLSLDGADQKRVAVTGASGGGTQTILLTALDKRVKVSVPVAMVSSYMFGGCSCESGKPIHRSKEHFTNNVEITAMAVPGQLLIISDGKDWTANTPKVGFPFIQKIYALYSARNKVKNIHFADEGHDYGPNKREAMYKFIAKHLGLDIARIRTRDRKIDESKVTIENMSMMQVFDDSHPFPENVCKTMEEIEASLKSLQE